MHYIFYPKVATRTNFSEHFAAAKIEMGRKFLSLDYICRSCNLRMVATLVATYANFFFTNHDLNEGKLRRISRIRVKSRASRTSREAWEECAKAMVAGKCDETKIKSTYGTNKKGGKETEEVADGKDVSSRVSLT